MKTRSRKRSALLNAGLLLLCLPCSLPVQSEQKPSATQVSVAKTLNEAVARRSPPFLRAQMSLSTAALAYGKNQVNHMLKDRPTMRRYVTAGDPLYIYAVQMFAGAATGERIAWHSEPPEGCPADHRSPFRGSPGYIRVNQTYLTGEHKGQERNGAELWENAIFELNNIGNDRTFEKIEEAVRTGKMNKQEFLKYVTQQEYKALQKSMEVYVTLWKPCMQARGMADDPVGWWADLPATYEEWIAQYTDHNNYPWVPYSKDFDIMVAYGVKSRSHVR